MQIIESSSFHVAAAEFQHWKKTAIGLATEAAELFNTVFKI